ncbi:hypothetical protein D3C87_1543220 [compost metagenome]
MIKECLHALGLVHAVQRSEQCAAVWLVGTFVVIENDHVAAIPAIFVGFGADGGIAVDYRFVIEQWRLNTVGLGAVHAETHIHSFDRMLDIHNQCLRENRRRVPHLRRIEFEGIFAIVFETSDDSHALVRLLQLQHICGR